jgi:hypothetical protein
VNAPRIGEILHEMGVLHEQDIVEIVEQQARTGQKFGHIATRWGLASPAQIWEAWARQLAVEVRVVDLEEIGTDSAALWRVTPELVVRYRIWPIRLWGDHLVIARAADCPPESLHELGRHLGLTVHTCVAPAEQIDSYIRHLVAPYGRSYEDADDPCLCRS